MSIFYNLFKQIRITYGITVCNEARELDELLSTLIPLIGKRDSVLVLQDTTQEYAAVNEIIAKYKVSIKHVRAKLDGDFATFKNVLIAEATGSYLFQIDADEIPKPSLIKNIKRIVRRKVKAECFLVPRINIVNGLTDEHITKWNWTRDEQNRVNYPDYQFRLFRLNGKIKWRYKVHEKLCGFKKSFHLPAESEEFCLVHVKEIVRQEKQNEFYDSLSTDDNKKPASI
ncbi:hypothetical protein A0256_07960 [Mucilaginibacter sp. PAMC 26640]|nr:hypothetical protein A0256_07960 [Mucilaginibacter sp. PAMC 26640]